MALDAGGRKAVSPAAPVHAFGLKSRFWHLWDFIVWRSLQLSLSTDSHSHSLPTDNIGQTGLQHPSVESMNFAVQVEAWLSQITPHDQTNFRAKPIVETVLASAPRSLLLIEHPETRLHSKTIVKLGEFFSLAASTGIQVVLETHSDHLLNGIRLAIHGGRLAPDDVQLNYISLTRQGLTDVVSPILDRNGRIDHWPNGLFDEGENSLCGLLEPAV
ncbi:AAA family ATPase [Laspinema olomoucense]|uniref:AAA family ATPase n=1 Tax=Laspinema olomoucense TaxID=3231600 RepID=UPI0021BB0C80|nr:DUF3696 domain-containing protein [Laspinema sp. D3d]